MIRRTDPVIPDIIIYPHLLHLALNSLYFRTLFLQVGRTKWSHLRSHQQP